MELRGTFLWNSMENVDAGISMGNVLILHANVFHGNLWRNFHRIPWKLMSSSSIEFHGEFSMEIHGILWRFFTQDGLS